MFDELVDILDSILDLFRLGKSQGYSEGYCEGFIRAWNTQAEIRKCCADCSFFSYDVKLECGICNKPSIRTMIDETDRVCRWFSESKDDSDRIERQNHGKHQYRMR